MQALPAFSLGDSFSIVDGKVTGLEGMWFSSTPIYVDPLLGPQPIGGVWFNADLHIATGNTVSAAAAVNNSVALTAHEFGVNLPEPSTWTTLAVGLVGLGAMLQSKRKRHNKM
jgi:hypothetical protein